MTFRTFPARIESAYDSDTLTAVADLGFAVWRRVTARLEGINGRELRDPGGREARDHLLSLAPYGTPVLLTSLRWDKYGDRVVSRITLPDGRDLADTLVADGYAVPWDGRGERPVPAWPLLT